VTRSGTAETIRALGVRALRCRVRTLALAVILACLVSSCGTDGVRERASSSAQPTGSPSEGCPTIPPTTHRREEMTLQPTQAQPGDSFRAVYARSRTRTEVLYLTPTHGDCTIYVLTPGLDGTTWKEMPRQGEFTIRERRTAGRSLPESCLIPRGPVRIASATTRETVRCSRSRSSGSLQIRASHKSASELQDRCSDEVGR
jgi:hypothetical protein